MLLRVISGSLCFLFAACSSSLPPFNPTMVPLEGSKYRSEIELQQAFKLADTRCQSAAYAAVAQSAPSVNVEVGPPMPGIVGAYSQGARDGRAERAEQEREMAKRAHWRACMGNEGFIEPVAASKR